MYFGEKYQDNDRAYDTDVYSRPEIERILKVAFETAQRRNHHLTVVDKANVLASSRLWRQIAKEMEPQYPDVQTDYMFIDNCSMRVLTDPRFFDVIVTENTFGDILTDETSAITGYQCRSDHFRRNTSLIALSDGRGTMGEAHARRCQARSRRKSRTLNSRIDRP